MSERPQVFKRHRMWWWFMEGRPSMGGEPGRWWRGRCRPAAFGCDHTKAAAEDTLTAAIRHFEFLESKDDPPQLPPGYVLVGFDPVKARVLMDMKDALGPLSAICHSGLLDRALVATPRTSSGRHTTGRRKLPEPPGGWADQDRLARLAGCSSWAEWAGKVLEREVDGSVHE